MKAGPRPGPARGPGYARTESGDVGGTERSPARLGRGVRGALFAAILAAAFPACRIDLLEWKSLARLSSQIDQFDRRLELTIDNSAYEAFADFPVLVVLDSSRIDTTRLAANPRIRFYDAGLGEILAHEIEEWDPVGDSFKVWVRIPSIPVGTTRFYLYYDCRLDDVDPSPADVWSNGYYGVWHLNETSGSVYRNSVSGGPDAVGAGPSAVPAAPDFTTPTPVAGLIGGGQAITAATDAIRIRGLAGFNFQPFTVSVWVDSPGPGGRLVQVGDAALNNRVDLSWASVSGNISMEINFSDDDPLTANDRLLARNMGELPGTIPGEYLTFRWTGGSDEGGDPPSIPPNGVYFFRNGVIQTGNRAALGDGAGSFVGGEGADVHVGNASWNSASATPGTYDELRISRVERSQKWLAAEYATLVDAYLAYGPDEALH